MLTLTNPWFFVGLWREGRAWLFFCSHLSTTVEVPTPSNGEPLN
jgi:hypothetical protein